MKTSFIALTLLPISFCLLAQEPNQPPQDTSFAVTQREANSSVWQRTKYQQLPSGEWVPHIESYQEIATGLNYKNPDTGQWEESSENIEIVPGGAVAKHGQHKIIFASDLATVGAIDMETPDGQRLQSHLLGLAYLDQATGQSVFIAQVTNSIGQLISSNQVWYDNAFTGVRAGVRYTYKRDGFEQDIILEEQPPTPESYGLNSSTTILQAYTEFISPPAPVVSMNFIPTGAGQQLPDKTLSFATMKIGRGHAFLMGNSSQATPVAKDWAIVEDRQFLIEEIPIKQISGQLQSLPPSLGASIRFSNSVVNAVASKRLIPDTPIVKSDTNQLQMARNLRKIDGFVLDYSSLITSQTNYIFRGDTTYYISGDVNLYGTNTTFEGGTVIKYATGVSLVVNTPVKWWAGPYHPVSMLGKDDDTLGEPISGSTGNPGNNYYAAKAVYFDGASALTNLIVQNLRVANANLAVVINGQSNHVLSDLQLIKCADGIAATNTDFCLRNGLFALVRTNFTGSSATGRVEHLTSDTSIWLNSDIGPNLFLTNCLLSAVTNLGNCATQNVAIVTSSNGVFRAVGAGNFYLADNSPYRDTGTTNISPSLQARLRQKTTYPPAFYSNVTVSADTTFYPQIQRDMGIPDLGYHYDPIDYLVDSYWVTNATLTVQSGAVVAGYYDSGLLITDGSSIVSIGTPQQPNWFTLYSTVQEQSVALGITTLTFAETVNSFHATRAPSGRFQFSKFSYPAGGGNHLYHNQQNWTYSNLVVEDCEFWGGKNDFSGYNSSTATLRNNLFVRTSFAGLPNGFTNNFLAVSNNLFWGDNVTVRPFSNSNSWYFFNNSFDHSSNVMAGVLPQNVINGFNAYIGDTNVTKRLIPPGAGDILIASFNYQTGFLGDFYQSPTSVLVNTGSVTANLAGLYHFTSQTNQIKETNSVVDIGFHYVSLDSMGSPIDTDGDGLSDYFEDANGNGIFDTGDPFDWLNPDADGSGDGLVKFANGMSLHIFEPKPTSQIP